MFFVLLCYQILCNRTKQCTLRNGIIDLTPSNYDAVIGSGRPVFVRLENNGCPYAKTSEFYWKEASQLFPNIQFARTECIKNAKLCRQLGAFYSPSHALYGPNSKKMIAFFSNPVDISKSSQYYADTIVQTLSMYSFDVPTIEDILPQNSNLFFESHKYPIFILYNSKCYEDVDFVSTWITKITDGDVDSEHFGFGKIDCSEYPDECERWGVSYPSANVYSREKGVSVPITEADHLAKRLNSVVEFLEETKQVNPTPAPYARPVKTPEPPIENVKKYTIDELEKRTVDEVRTKYNIAKQKSYTGGDYGGNIPDILSCQNVTIRQELIDDTIRFINFFRELVGLNAPVTNNADRNADCYLGAKYLTRKGSVSHYPDANLKGYCEFNVGNNWQHLSDVLRESSLAQGYGHEYLLSMISGLMDDEGANNEGIVGHRRWFLYPYLKKVGVGYYPKSKHYLDNKRVIEYPPSGVFSIDYDKYYDIEYPFINFIAYPPPGPFPRERLPTSWNIYYRGFQDTEVKIDNIILKMTRDDGIELDYQRIDFSNTKDLVYGMRGQLVWKLSDKSFELVTAGHSINVQVYLLKGETRDLLEYNIKFFDDKSESSICFYNTDKSKCPADIEDSKKFGAGEYSEYDLTGYARTIITVAEDIMIEDDNITFDYSPEIIVKGKTINGKIVIPEGVNVDFGDPEKTEIVIMMNPNKFNTGNLVSSRSPKSIHIEFSEYPSNRGDIRILFYIGPYTPITYLNRAVNGEFRYFYGLKYDDTYTYLVSLVYTDVEFACQGGIAFYNDIIPADTKCFAFHRFNDLRFLKTRKPLLRIYADKTLNVTGNGFPEGYYDVQIFGRNTYTFNIELEFSDRLNEKVRSLYISKIGGAQINPYFKFPVRTYSAPMLYKDLMVFPYRNITINNYPAAFQNIVEGYSLTNVQGDWNARKYLNKNFYVKLNETEKPFADQNGKYEYTKADMNHQLDFPIIVTNGLHDKYTLTWAYQAAGNPLQIQASPQSASKPVIFDFPVTNESGHDFQNIFFKDYKDLTVICTKVNYTWTTSWDNAVYWELKNYFLKFRIINCSRVRFYDKDPTKQVQHMSTDIIGDVNVDIASDPILPVSFDLVNFRTNKKVTCTNTYLKEIIVYECSPTIKDARISFTTVIDSNVKFVNCTITGPVELRFCDGYNLPSIYLQNCTFNPSSIKVQIFSDAYLYGTDVARLLEKNEGLDLIIVGLEPSELSKLTNKFTFVNEKGATTNNKKVVFSKDGKGIHLADSSFNVDQAPESVPEKYDIDNPENYIEKEEVELPEYSHEDEKDDNFDQKLEINPLATPPPATPLATQSQKPDPTQAPTQAPTTQSQPQVPGSPQAPTTQSQPQVPGSPQAPTTQSQPQVSGSPQVPDQSTTKEEEDGSENDSNSKKKGLNVGLISGIIAGALVVIGVIIGVIIFVVIRHRHKHEDSTDFAGDIPADAQQKDDKKNDENEVENLNQAGEQL